VALIHLTDLRFNREMQHWFGYTAPAFPGSQFIPRILGTIVFLYGGIVFIRGAQGELSDRNAGMMTLIPMKPRMRRRYAPET